MILQVLISTCLGSIFPLLWSMYADTADYSELKTGRRATGLIFSSSSMSQKFGWTIGGTLTGWLLGYYGFQANVEQTAGAVFGIRLMLSVLPAAGTALSLLLILFYPLSEKRMEGVNEQLTQLRKQATMTDDILSLLRCETERELLETYFPSGWNGRLIRFGAVSWAVSTARAMRMYPPTRAPC